MLITPDWSVKSAMGVAETKLGKNKHIVHNFHLSEQLEIVRQLKGKSKDIAMLR